MRSPTVFLRNWGAARRARCLGFTSSLCPNPSEDGFYESAEVRSQRSPALDMLASTKALKLVQDAKVTLPNFATQEVAKFMTRNAGTIKICGTVLSRVREMKSDFTHHSEGSDEDDDEMDSPCPIPSRPRCFSNSCRC
jgi:hypothetical protein